MSKEKEFVKVSNLRKEYSAKKTNIFKRKGKILAVDDVSFTINKGETYGLVGESGSGKTTTGFIVNGLVKSSRGSIEIDGKNINLLSYTRKKELRGKMQFVFQDPYSSLNPKKRINHILEEALIIHGHRDSKLRKEKVLETLELVGLDGSYLERYPHELSGGQRQRIGIARAIILKPEFIILDEPVSALDVSVQAQILNLLKDLQKKMNLTYLFISHDLNVIHYMSDKVGVMYKGKIVEEAPAEKIFDIPLHPYTKALISCLPGENMEFDFEEIPTSDGEEILEVEKVNAGCIFYSRCKNCRSECLFYPQKLREVSSNHYVSCCNY